MADQETTRIANWIIMVYIAADDTLANFAVGSLKQLKRLASRGVDVVVAAQFDADGRRNIPRLIFEGDGDSRGSIRDNEKDKIPFDTDMADPCALSNFIDWAYTCCKAKHYCLVLWGHGPELLIADYPAGGNGETPKRFLTPPDLRKALADTNLIKDGHKFDIVGMDSCCMSMVELVCELQGYAEFLVASQEEVPDFSFPYDKLLAVGKNKNRNDVAKVCQEIPDLYIEGYRDYILTRGTKLESITLSSLSVKDVVTITGPLARLAADLMNSVHDNEKRQAVIDARANSKTFVAGLYVDLYDFCEQLRNRLSSSKNIHDRELIAICKEICGAIHSRGDKAFVIGNQSPQNKHCHGISIYFPYLTNLEKTAVDISSGPLAMESMDVMNKRGMDTLKKDARNTRKRGGMDVLNMGGLDVLNKGGLDVLNKGGMDVLNKSELDILNKMRSRRIEETEHYYRDLELSAKTHWDKFIQHCWSRWLVEDAEAKAKSSPETDLSGILDQRYSAQQCALNLLSLCRNLEQGSQSSGSRAGGPGVHPGGRTLRATGST